MVINLGYSFFCFTVISEETLSSSPERIFNCQCTCGNIIKISEIFILSKEIKSCGCVHTCFDPKGLYVYDYFKENSYTRIYLKIINNAKNRSLVPDTYYENHHIVPRSILNNNHTVKLIAKEHFICHLLLVKMVISKNYKYKMLNAFHMMQNTRKFGKINSKLYQKIKIDIADAKRELYTGKGNPFYGKTHSEKVLLKIKKSREQYDFSGKNNPNYGRSWTAAQRARASIIKRNISDETRRRLSLAQRGKKLSDAHKEKLRITSTGQVKSLLSREKCRITKLGERNPNYGKVYSAYYKEEMRNRISQISANMMKNRAIRIYKAVFSKFGNFTEESYEEAKTNNFLVKRPTTYNKIITLLNLDPSDIFVQKKLVLWEGNRIYSSKYAL
jgi:hypothetical protein